MAKLFLFPSMLLILGFFFYEAASSDTTFVWSEKALESRKVISDNLGAAIKSNKFPENKVFDINSKKNDLSILYTLSPDLQNESESLLKKYKPDYGAIVLFDAKTGQILAMSSWQKSDPSANNLNLRATFPAASIFKVITAAAAVDHAGIEPNHRIAFNGGNYTLYKKNVLSENINRWTRFISLKDAFARSINTAFGRLTLENIEPRVLSDYAEKFMFNHDIPTDFPLDKSLAQVPDKKGFELTQVASGYNRYNTLSPVHGAMIAGSIINDGKMLAPHIVQELKNSAGETIFKAQPYEIGQVISKESAQKVQLMMEQTVLTGTSRKTFKKIVRDKKFREVEMGGKTGHFTGMNPKGRTDWFVGYASDGENIVAIATITVNIKKWTVKSSALAEMMFRKYYNSVLEEKEIASVSR